MGCGCTGLGLSKLTGSARRATGRKRRGRTTGRKRATGRKTGRKSAARMAHGDRTYWNPTEGGWHGQGASGAAYEIEAIVTPRVGRRSFVEWRLTGRGISSRTFVSTGDAMEAADAHEMRLARRSA